MTLAHKFNEVLEPFLIIYLLLKYICYTVSSLAVFSRRMNNQPRLPVYLPKKLVNSVKLTSTSDQKACVFITLHFLFF